MEEKILEELERKRSCTNQLFTVWMLSEKDYYKEQKKKPMTM